MTEKILLSIEPVAPTRWVTDVQTGARFEILALDADEDEAAVARHTDMLGRLNQISFGIEILVEKKKLAAWEGIGSKGAPAACSPENITALLKRQGRRLVPWLIGECRSLENYRVAEVGEAKKD